MKHRFWIQELDIATDEAPVLDTRAFLIGFRMTKPESQKTGMETTQPMSSIARTGFFFPTRLMTMSASFRAAPVCSRMLPIRAPSIITIPILENVPEKPWPMTFARPLRTVPSSRVVSTSGMPAITPRTREMHMMETNG